MNIKKYTLKTMCAALACSTFMSGLLAANATGVIISESPMDEQIDTGSNWNTEESNFEEIEVTYKQSSSYFVTIPKTIALDMKKQAAYSVKVTGDIDANQRVYVAPVDGIPITENLDFYMKDQTPDSKKADVVATVTQSKFYWNSEEVTVGYEEADNFVSAPDLTAGTWKGTFQVEINLQTEKEHEHTYVDGVCTGCGKTDPNHTHNYVDGICSICGEAESIHEHNYIDGKCECGEIDPNHEHNFVDGTCTICGEADLYEVAPATAYSNWNYTLDDENGTITLNYYIGSETYVTVYARYEINGKIYKTQLASNDTNATSNYIFAKKSNIKGITFNEGIDTSKTTSMSYMFSGCWSLTNLDISNLDTSNVTDMSYMFYLGSRQIISGIDVSNFNTSNVTTMNHMFCGTDAVNIIGLNNFDTSNVIDMNSMFLNSNYLTSLDLSNFDTSKVVDMDNMFYGCSTLSSLDLSSFDIHNALSMRYMFYNCSALKTIYVTDEKWVINSECDVEKMLSSCGTSSVTYKE